MLLTIFTTVYCLPEHTTPTSSLCWQSCFPQPGEEQLHRDISFPSHSTSSSHMGPEPGPNQAGTCWLLRATPHCSCLHTTWASLISQESSHTVPHEPLWKTSSLPAQSPPEPTSLMDPWTDIQWKKNTLLTTNNWRICPDVVLLTKAGDWQLLCGAAVESLWRAAVPQMRFTPRALEARHTLMTVFRTGWRGAIEVQHRSTAQLSADHRGFSETPGVQQNSPPDLMDENFQLPLTLSLSRQPHQTVMKSQRGTLGKDAKFY